MTVKIKMDDSFSEVVLHVGKRLHQREIGWFLIGSTGLALRGVDIGRNPKDIDFLVAMENLPRVKALFNDYRPFLDERELGDGHGGQFRFLVGGRQIHFCAENGRGIYLRRLRGRDLLETIALDGFSIPAFPLYLEATCYEDMGRPERAELIRRSIHPFGIVTCPTPSPLWAMPEEWREEPQRPAPRLREP